MNSSFISKYKLTIILTLTLAVFLASCISLPTTTPTPGWVVTTLAGNGTAGHHDATGTEAQFNYPTGVAVDPSGILYVADAGNHCIRKITSAGVVTTLAGSGTRGHKDAIGTAAQFDGPVGVAVDSSGILYVADAGNGRIRKITSTGVVSTFAGSTYGYKNATGEAAQFDTPFDVAVDSSGILYVADLSNHRIRKITSAGVVSTLAGGYRGHYDATAQRRSLTIPPAWPWIHPAISMWQIQETTAYGKLYRQG